MAVRPKCGTAAAAFWHAAAGRSKRVLSALAKQLATYKGFFFF